VRDNSSGRSRGCEKTARPSGRGGARKREPSAIPESGALPLVPLKDCHGLLLEKPEFSVSLFQRAQLCARRTLDRRPEGQGAGESSLLLLHTLTAKRGCRTIRALGLDRSPLRFGYLAPCQRHALTAARRLVSSASSKDPRCINLAGLIQLGLQTRKHGFESREIFVETLNPKKALRTIPESGSGRSGFARSNCAPHPTSRPFIELAVRLLPNVGCELTVPALRAAINEKRRRCWSGAVKDLEVGYQSGSRGRALAPWSTGVTWAPTVSPDLFFAQTIHSCVRASGGFAVSP